MASSISFTESDRWTVLVNCPVDEGRTKTYKLPTTTTIEELKTKWSQDVNASASIRFKTVNGDIAHHDQHLIDIGESYVGTQVITLIVECDENVNLLLKQYKSTADPTSVLISLDGTPTDLEMTIRQLFNISEGQQYQVLFEDKPLEWDKSFREQNVEANSTLVVDVAFEIEMTEAWSGHCDELILYSSNQSDLLMYEDVDMPQRVYHGKRIVDMTDKDIAELLLSLGIVSETSLSLECHILQDLTIFTRLGSQELCVWPTDRLQKALPKLPKLYFNGEGISKTAQLHEVDLPDCSLLLPESITLQVKAKWSCDYFVIRVPYLATVSDVKTAFISSIYARMVSKKENDLEKDLEIKRFDLKRGAQVLNDDDTIASLRLEDGDILTAESNIMSLRVGLTDRSVRIQAQRRCLCFTDVMTMTTAKSGIMYATLLEKTLCCRGCGRQLSRANEKWQPIPAPCCEVASLDLIEMAPAKTKEADTQTACQSRCQDEEVRESFGITTKTSTSEADTQTPRQSRGQEGKVCESIGVTARTSTYDVGVQMKPMKLSFVQQHPAKRKRPFFIWSFYPGRSDVTCDLPLPDPANVGDVREAISEKLKIHRFALNRDLFRSGRHEYFHVCDRWGNMKHPFWNHGEADFGNVNGEMRCRPTLGGWPERLDDDNEAFPIVPGRRNIIQIHA